MSILTALAAVAKLYEFSETRLTQTNMPILILLVGVALAVFYWQVRRGLEKLVIELSTPGTARSWKPSNLLERAMLSRGLKRGELIPSSNGYYIAASIHHMSVRFATRRRA